MLKITMNFQKENMTSLIRDVGGLPTDGWIVPTNNDGDKPFNGGGNQPWRGSVDGPPWGDNNYPPWSGSDGPQKTKVQDHTLQHQQDCG